METNGRQNSALVMGLKGSKLCTKRLTNAPVSFQCFMTEVFKELLDMCVVVYLEDILIVPYSPDEHLHRVRKVLRHLCANNLYAKVEKITLSVDTTDFLGFFIGPDGLQMDDTKIQVIRDWPTPRKVKDVQSFLGFADFYQRFITPYSGITIPLAQLTRKNAPWIWSLVSEDAFQLLKVALNPVPILHHFDPSLLPVAKIDASDYAIAPLAFDSRRLALAKPPKQFGYLHHLPHDTLDRTSHGRGECDFVTKTFEVQQLEARALIVDRVC